MNDLYMISAIYFFVRGISESESKHWVAAMFSILASVLLGFVWMTTFSSGGS